MAHLKRTRGSANTTLSPRDRTEVTGTQCIALPKHPLPSTNFHHHTAVHNQPRHRGCSSAERPNTSDAATDSVAGPNVPQPLISHRLVGVAVLQGARLPLKLLEPVVLRKPTMQTSRSGGDGRFGDMCASRGRAKVKMSFERWRTMHRKPASQGLLAVDIVVEREGNPPDSCSTLLAVSGQTTARGN